MFKYKVIPVQKRRLFLAWLIIACLVLAAACSPGQVTTTTEPAGQETTTANSAATTTATTALDTFNAYASAWQNQDFAAMYRLLTTESKAAATEEDFVKRYQNIVSGIEAKNILVSLADEAVVTPAAADRSVVAFKVGMDTLAGSLDIDGYKMVLQLETVDDKPTWLVSWSEQLLFPNMGPTDKIRARTLLPIRGEIRDRNGLGLAVNGQLTVIGIVPGKFRAVKDEAIPLMAQLLGIAEDKIAKILADATHDDWFYPVVTLPADSGDLSAQLTAIDGVQYQKTDGRIYPASEAAGLLIGYIGAITAEELAKHPDEGYTAQDKIGKMGLEQVYEQRLKGQSGGEIYLTDGDTDIVKEQIGITLPVNGDNITLALDLTVQNSLYAVMKSDAGAAAAINPQTGEILALVSTPSFDPNLLQTYVPDAVRAAWNDAVKDPFVNRFKVGYAPGSAFKLVTAAIGLKAGVINPDEALSISGLRWQPDASWGSYQVTRVKDIGRAVNLGDAFIYSDNIYFAMQALKIGADTFSQGAAGFGIGEALPIDYPFYLSQLTNEGFNRETLLADTGYGQGEILVSPLHLALFYSALANNGDILAPILELSAGTAPHIWKQQAVASANVSLLTNMLLQVVENPAGSGHTQPSSRIRILGKTGTAELKKSLDDDQAEENGWFVAMNVDDPRLAVAMMIEDVKTRGGSHYVVPLVKQVIDALLP